MKYDTPHLDLNNYELDDYVDRIYPIELGIKDTTHTASSASYLHLHLEIDSESGFRIRLFDKKLFPLWTFHLYVATFQQYPHNDYISLIWYNSLELQAPIMISLIEGSSNKEATEPRVPSG